MNRISWGLAAVVVVAAATGAGAEILEKQEGGKTVRVEIQGDRVVSRNVFHRGVERFWSETPTHRIKTKIRDGRVVGRWAFRKKPFDEYHPYREMIAVQKGEAIDPDHVCVRLGENELAVLQYFGTRVVRVTGGVAAVRVDDGEVTLELKTRGGRTVLASMHRADEGSLGKLRTGQQATVKGLVEGGDGTTLRIEAGAFHSASKAMSSPPSD